MKDDRPTDIYIGDLVYLARAGESPRMLKVTSIGPATSYRSDASGFTLEFRGPNPERLFQSSW